MRSPIIQHIKNLEHYLNTKLPEAPYTTALRAVFSFLFPLFVLHTRVKRKRVFAAPAANGVIYSRQNAEE